VTKEDFVNLKSAGIEHLRVPIGYWMLGGSFIHQGEPYVTGGWKYLERALGWAKELDLKVIIDLHGAPGKARSLPHSHKITIMITINQPPTLILETPTKQVFRMETITAATQVKT